MIAMRLAASILIMEAFIPTEGLAQHRVTTAGVLGGVNLAKLVGEDVGEVDPRIGIEISGYLSFGINRKLAIETGALYSQRGGRFFAGTGATATIKLNYVEIPVLLSARFARSARVTPFLSAGPAIAFRVGCGFSVSGGPNFFGTACSDLEEALDIRGGVRSVDPGLVGAAGIDVSGFRFSIRYYLGLATYEKPPSSSASRHRVISALVGYGFNLG